MIKKHNSYITYAKAPKNRIVKMGIFMCDGTETVEDWCKRQPKMPTFAINCSYFAWSDKLKKMVPIYSLAIGGEVLKQESMYDGMAIKDNKLFSAHITKVDCDDFVSGIPPIRKDNINLVTDGMVKMLSDISGKNPRSIIGYDNDNVYLITVDGRRTLKPGLRLDELNNLCQDIGLTDAINVDGGASSQLCYLGKNINDPILPLRPVLTIFAIWLDMEEDMEYIKPNMKGAIAPYIQADKNGVIKSQNNNYAVAYTSAVLMGWALWEVSTGARLYPKEKAEPVEPPKVEPPKETPLEPPKEEPSREKEYKTLLERIEKDIKAVLK